MHSQEHNASATKAPRGRRLVLAAISSVVLICAGAGGAYMFLVEGGSEAPVEKAEAPRIPVPMPVATWEAGSELRPADYSIAMVYQEEAILVARGIVVRARPGSVVPGLGRILEIRDEGPGGSVVATDATLQTF